MSFYRKTILDGWWVVLIVLGVAAVFFGSYVSDLQVEAGTNVLLNEDDPDLAYYNSTRPLWGYDEYAIFCVTREDWITPDGVALLQDIVKRLEAAPYVRKVVSLLDIPLLRQKEGPAINITELTYVTKEGVDYGRAREELIGHTQAQGSLISASGRDLAILVYIDVPEATARLDPIWSKLQGERKTNPDAEAELEKIRPELDAANQVLKERRTALVAEIRRIAAAMEAKLAEPVRLSGPAIININLVEHVTNDLEVFGLVSFAFFTLAFFLFYRRLRFTALPIVTCLLPVVLVVGAMAWLDMKITVITSNLPVLLFVLMLPYTVYFIERYRERRALDPREAQTESTLAAARAIWTPCFFSCTTTMAGFAALMTSGILPVRDFGKMMTIGMGAGLCIVFLAIPSLSRPLRPMTIAKAGAKAGTFGMVRWLERLSLAMPLAVVIGGIGLLVFSVVGATKLDAEAKFTEYFWPSSEVYQGLEYIDTRMGGTTSLEIMLESDEDKFFVKPEGLDALDAAASYFAGVAETGNVRSLKTLADELEKKNPLLIKMLPGLVNIGEVKALTREFANEDFTISRIFVRMRETAPTLNRNEILRGLREHLETEPRLAGLKVRETGIFLLYANMLNSLIDSQKDTFAMVVGAIFLMLIVLFRSPVLAFLVLLPQVLPAVVMLGIMGWFGITLDLVTVMIASVAMGVGIDASIQYTIRYRNELAADGDRHAALSRSHATIGRAIWIATSVIVLGFCVLMLSQFKPSVWFGLFTAIAMLMSQIAALTILPSIFLLTGYPKR